MAGVEDGIADNRESNTQNQKKGSEYEQSREERIKENLERMRKLGIYDLSLRFKSIKPNKTRKTPQRPSPLPTPQPGRRSSRLQSVTPVSYSEIPLGKNGKSLDFEDDLVMRSGGSKPEVYTEKHEKLLGSTDMSWTFFVDGYGMDGKRIYDPVRGKTCHQCRQKTLGHRTQCCKCNMVQGQFCGDCLFMRYGEHVLEAKQNPNWLCPVCRGICNCSLCRQAKGWAPTGPLYKKINRLGYKSVAHYLIQTHREKTDPDNNLPVEVPAKRSLPFDEESSEARAEEKVAKDAAGNDHQILLQPCSENGETNANVDKETHIVVNMTSQQTSSHVSEAILGDHIIESETSPKSENKNEKLSYDAKPFGSEIGQKTSPKSKRKLEDGEAISNSIAGRLRGRRAKNN